MDTSKLQALSHGEVNRLKPLLGDVRSQYINGSMQYFDPEALRSQLDQYIGLDKTQYEAIQPYLGDIKPITSAQDYQYFDRNQIGSLDFSNLAGQAPSQYDLTDAQYGIDGFTTKDIGGGKYNILGADSSVLGTGYKDPYAAAREMIEASARGKASQLTDVVDQYIPDLPDELYDISVNSIGDSYDTIKTLKPQFLGPNGALNTEALSAAGYMYNPRYNETKAVDTDWTGMAPTVNDETLISRFGKAKKGYTFGGNDYLTPEEAANAAAASLSDPEYATNPLASWELLGQALEGTPQITAGHEWGSVPLDFNNEVISGENALYGSTPVFKNGQLIGYKTDLTPGSDSALSWEDGRHNVKGTGTSYLSNYDGKKTAWSSLIGRKLNNPEDYAKYTQRIDDTGNVFIPLENVSKLPGWENVERSSYVDRNHNKNGFLSDIFGVVDPILDTIDPMHNQVQEWTTGSSETEDQAPYFQQYLPMILDAFLPGVGSIVGAADSASREDTKGIISNVVNYFMPTDFGMGSTAGNAAASAAAKAGTSTAINGGDLEDIAKAALLAGAIGGIGSGISTSVNNSDFYKASSPYEQALIRSGTKMGVGALGSLARGNDLEDSLVAGGLGATGAYLQSTIGDYLSSEYPELKADPKALGSLTNIIVSQIAKQAKKS